MKILRLLSILLLVAMTLSVFAACNVSDDTTDDTTSEQTTKAEESTSEEQ